jgi:hypothetical protein
VKDLIMEDMKNLKKMVMTDSVILRKNDLETKQSMKR